MTTATPTTGDTASFADLGLDRDLVDALDAKGITTPFPIQELTLGLALSGADIIGQARTGTGKTLAFGLPMLQNLDIAADRVQTLVIVPTRELCLQVAEDLEQAGRTKGVRVLAAYGGKSLDTQIDALAGGGVHVVVGTPGRLLDLLRRGVLRLSAVRGLVLDEADEMLDLGFLPDVEQLIEATPERRQTLLFSATMPSAVVALARRYMDRPTFLRADVEEVHIGPKTEQHFFSCHRMDKPAVLARILQTPNRGLCVVFCRTKRMCDILADELRERGIAAAPIHSDLRQDSREKALSRFRSGKIDVLVATEVAARGLDIDDVTHVVNYDCPDDEKMYLHRIGRTGRAGAAGVAITLAVWNELARLNMIKRALDIDVETHEVFSTSPILDELFDLPAREGRQKPAARAKAPAERSDAERSEADTAAGDRDRERGRDPGQRDARGRAGRRGRGRRGGRQQDADRASDAGRAAQEGEAAARVDEAAGRSAGEAAGTAETAGGEATSPRVRADRSTDADGPVIRRRRRSRSRAGEPTGQAVEAPEGDEGDEGTPAEAPPRVRRRTRTRDDAGAARTAGAEAGGDTGQGTEDAGAIGGRSRTRTRTRTAPGRATAGRSPGTPSGDDAEAAPPSRTRDERSRDADAGGDAEPAGDAPRRPAGRDRADRGDGGPAERRRGPEGSDAGRGGSPARRRKSGGGGRNRSGRDRSGRDRSGSDRSQQGNGSGGGAGRQAVVLTTDEARGDGRPRLRRPLEVAHLP